MMKKRRRKYPISDDEKRFYEAFEKLQSLNIPLYFREEYGDASNYSWGQLADILEAKIAKIDKGERER